ncbi:MAG: hypothetical protein ACYDBQ_10675 [Thermoplasmatota archaeon]
MSAPRAATVAVTGSDWGQGKTDAALTVAFGLAQEGFTVGGVCIRRQYAPALHGFEVVGLEAFFPKTGESVVVARRDYRGDELLRHRADRAPGLRTGLEGTFWVSHKALAETARRIRLDASTVDAFLMDEVGPLFFKTARTKRRRRSPFYEVAEMVAENPRPCTLFVFSDPDMQSTECLGIRRLLEANPDVLHVVLHPGNFRVLAYQILQRFMDGCGRAGRGPEEKIVA